MHFVPIVKITLPMHVRTDVLMVDVLILIHGIRNSILFNTQKIKVGLAIF